MSARRGKILVPPFPLHCETNAEVSMQQASDERNLSWTPDDFLAVVCEWIDGDGARLAAFNQHLARNLKLPVEDFA